MRVALITISRLSVSSISRGEKIPLLEDLSISISPGETFCLVGESGSGKTTFAHAITGLFAAGSQMRVEGRVEIDGDELVFNDFGATRRWRGKIRYVFQEPWLALNPLARIRSQLRLAAKAAGVSEGDEGLAARLLEQVGIENCDDVLEAYPHQLSGGLAQRVMIALALLTSPKLLIADEPTSSLDAMHRLQILALLNSLKEKGQLSILFLTHDLDIARRFGDMVAVLYAGRIVELGPAQDFFRAPLHPYSQALVRWSESRSLVSGSYSEQMAVGGEPVAKPGCRFHARCPKAQLDCIDNEPQLQIIDSVRQVRCPYWKS